MKKIYSLLAMSTLVGATFAQSPYAGNAYIESTSTFERSDATLKTPSDTAGLTASGFFYPEFAAGGSVVRYGNAAGGSIYGSSGDSLNISAQGYENASGINFDVEEVLAWFYSKHQANAASSMNIEIYSMAANAAYTHDGTNWVPNSAEGPSSLLGSAALSIADVDTVWPNMTSIPFSSPIAVTGTNFAVALDASSFEASGDTVGLFSDTDGEGQRYAFHNLGVWAVTADVFGGLNNNIALFPVIGNANVGIDSDEFLNGIQMSAFPNPAVVNTTIEFNLNKAFTSVKVEVIDATGKKVATINKGALAQGNYKEVVDFSNVAAGKYYYSVITNESRLTKKIMVVK